MTALEEFLASVLPTFASEPARCPKCGGRLTTTITIYAQTHVYVDRFSDGRAYCRYTGDLSETKKALGEQAADNYAESQVDERDELRCENEDCDYWANPVDIEFGRE